MAEKKQANRLMKMSQLADRTGLSVSTIKFYIAQGLLPRPVKTKPNVAYYDDAFLKRLLIVKKMRSEGLSVSSIKSILDKYPFQKISEWEAFKRRAKKKEAYERETEERLATQSGEEQRREAILDAAFDVFSINGYHNATVDDIARKAGVSKGTCYQYFSGKEAIFIATIDRTFEKIVSEAEVASAQAGDALMRLGIKGLTFVSKFRDLQSMFIGLYSEIMGGNERLKRKTAEVFERIVDFLSRDIDKAITDRTFRPVDSRIVSLALIGIAEAAGNLYLVEEDFDVLDFFTRLIDFMQHGLSPGD